MPPRSFGRLAHEHVGRVSSCAQTRGETSTSSPRLTAFDDVESRSGIFFGGARPCMVLCERGLPCVVPLGAPLAEGTGAGTARGTPFCAVQVVRGFACAVACGSGAVAMDKVHVCAGLGNCMLSSAVSSGCSLVAHKTPLAAHPRKIAALAAPPPGVTCAPALAVLVSRCSHKAPPRSLPNDDSCEPATTAPRRLWPLEALRDSACGGAPLATSADGSLPDVQRLVEDSTLVFLSLVETGVRGSSVRSRVFWRAT